mmetsp:Transcript_3627/g.8610  ORF Transcript_3627/g.8610 Transcript_3627/m.8610 type:complete len:216 (-) Transcript_3627:1311-1958(-)
MLFGDDRCGLHHFPGQRSLVRGELGLRQAVSAAAVGRRLLGGAHGASFGDPTRWALGGGERNRQRPRGQHRVHPRGGHFGHQDGRLEQGEPTRAGQLRAGAVAVAVSGSSGHRPDVLLRPEERAALADPLPHGAPRAERRQGVFCPPGHGEGRHSRGLLAGALVDRRLLPGLYGSGRCRHRHRNLEDPAFHPKAAALWSQVLYCGLVILPVDRFY